MLRLERVLNRMEGEGEVLGERGERERTREEKLLESSNEPEPDRAAAPRTATPQTGLSQFLWRQRERDRLQHVYTNTNTSVQT